MQPQSGWRTDRHRLAQAPQAVAILLAVLAQAGSDDPAAAERAFKAGLDRVLPGAGYPYAPPAQGVLALENAWPSLVGMPPEDTQRLVGGVVATIADDGKTTLTEMELLRTMCAILHCPLPSDPPDAPESQGPHNSSAARSNMPWWTRPVDVGGLQDGAVRAAGRATSIIARPRTSVVVSDRGANRRRIGNSGVATTYPARYSRVREPAPCSGWMMPGRNM